MRDLHHLLARQRDGSIHEGSLHEAEILHSAGEARRNHLKHRDRSVILDPPRQVYPRATSRSIMMANPAMAPPVPRSVLPLLCDSGMTSSTTT